MLSFAVQSILGVIFVMLSVTFFSLFERKVMGFVQHRKGPNKVGVKGTLQPFSDGMKLVIKGESPPLNSLGWVYFLPPMYMFFLSVVMFHLVPLEVSSQAQHLSGVILIFLFSITLFGSIFTGWTSNSTYSKIGAVRSFSQTVSFEIGLSLTLLTLFVVVNSVSLYSFFGGKIWLIFPLLVLFLPVFFIFLAESNRSPFDLAEGESELVSGFCVEYGGVSYTFTFLGENISLIFLCSLLSLMFGGKSVVFFLMCMSVFVLIRATLPRIRFDKLMDLIWIETLSPLLGVGLMYILIMYGPQYICVHPTSNWEDLLSGGVQV